MTFRTSTAACALTCFLVRAFMFSHSETMRASQTEQSHHNASSQKVRTISKWFLTKWQLHVMRRSHNNRSQASPPVQSYCYPWLYSFVKANKKKFRFSCTNIVLMYSCSLYLVPVESNWTLKDVRFSVWSHNCDGAALQGTASIGTKL